jgi:hypothetical protein
MPRKDFHLVRVHEAFSIFSRVNEPLIVLIAWLTDGGEPRSISPDVSPHEFGMRIGQDGLERRIKFIHFIDLQELDACLQTKVHRSLEC